MKKIFTTILLCSTLGAYAQTTGDTNFQKELSSLSEKVEALENELKQQTDPLKSNLRTLRSENQKLKNEVSGLEDKLDEAKQKLESVSAQTQSNTNSISQTADELGIKIKETDASASHKITAVGKTVSDTSLYGLIGILSAILISGLLYGFLFKRQSSDKTALLEKLNQTNTDILEQLNKTKIEIEEGLVKEFGKQTELIDSQLQLIEQQKTEVQTAQSAEPDHSLALKVASEINLIERNVSLMDSKTRGLKQLMASVRKLKDNLAANGYEMPELLGKQFHQGMKVIVANSIPDENLEKGSEIITKVLIPQVNFNDKMIQTGQIETARGY